MEYKFDFDKYLTDYQFYLKVVKKKIYKSLIFSTILFMVLGWLIKYLLNIKADGVAIFIFIILLIYLFFNIIFCCINLRRIKLIYYQPLCDIKHTRAILNKLWDFYNIDSGIITSLFNLYYYIEYPFWYWLRSSIDVDRKREFYYIKRAYKNFKIMRDIQ